MAKGRKPLPQGIKDARGTSQPCRQKTSTLEVAIIQAVAAPSWLDTKAKKVFKEKANYLTALKILTPLDIDQLAIYADAYSQIITAEKEIKEKGVMVDKYVKGVKCGLTPNPYIKLKLEFIKVVSLIGSNFGFSPVARLRFISPVKDDNQDEFNEFD